MPLLTSCHAPREPERLPDNPLRFYKVGTLRYDRHHLVVLFFWLMWNDFGIMLLQQINSLNSVLMKNYGATYAEMGILSSIGCVATFWINPFVSTWSDRFRSPLGRRRPFLFAAAPPFALFLALTPYGPTLYHFLLRYPSAAAVAGHLPMNGPALLIGICGLVSGIFNTALLAIFSYLYFDVVPESHMGRFQSLSKTATLVAALIWNFFIFGIADHHIKSVYVGTAVFSFAVYMVSTWQIKEGDYPPPDTHKKGGVFAPIRSYFVECFNQPYYLWVFAAAWIFMIGNSGNNFQFFYLHYDLKLDLAVIGWTVGWSSVLATGFGLLCGFAIGSITDLLKPARLMGPAIFLYALEKLVSYFFIHDKWTCLIFACIDSVVAFIVGVVMGAFTVEIFPREKIGQFCSAQALTYTAGGILTGPLTGMFFDNIRNNRSAYLWSAGFYSLDALIYMKVYMNWKMRHGHSPVPHAG